MTGAGALRNEKHTHTHSCSNQSQSPDSKAQRKSYTCRESSWWLLHVAGGGVLLRWAPWTSHLEGNCCAFRLACPGGPERATPQPAHTENPHVSKTPSASPAGLAERKKNNTGWFVQVIIFIPEQLEDTSLNVLPRELSESQRSELGASRAGWDDAPQLRAAHTHYTAYP